MLTAPDNYTRGSVFNTLWAMSIWLGTIFSTIWQCGSIFRAGTVCQAKECTCHAATNQVAQMFQHRHTSCKTLLLLSGLECCESICLSACADSMFPDASSAAIVLRASPNSFSNCSERLCASRTVALESVTDFSASDSCRSSCSKFRSTDNSFALRSESEDAASCVAHIRELRSI